MPEPKDLVLPMLREMRNEMREGFEDTKLQFKVVNERLNKIEGAQKSFLNALTADTMMSKFITGDFEERIVALEKKMDGLLKTPRS